MDEKELSIDEFKTIIDQYKEIDIDLDEFSNSFIEREAKQLYEDEIRERFDGIADSMSRSLDRGNYVEAYSKANRLRGLDSNEYRDEIDRCYELCVEHDVPEALIDTAYKYINTTECMVKPGAFVYLEKLSDMGYIDSFQWLADCYYHGIGCEKDIDKAKKLYFEGMIFGKNKYCIQRYGELSKETDFDGDELVKNVIQCILEKGFSYEQNEIARIAGFIHEGRIKGYGNKAVYVLLKDVNRLFGNGIALSLLGESLLYGLCTDPNPVVADMILKDAINWLEYIVSDPDDKWIKKQISESFYEYDDFVKAYVRTKEMIEDAKTRTLTAKFLEYEGFDSLDEHLMIGEWEHKKEMFIDRLPS